MSKKLHWCLFIGCWFFIAWAIIGLVVWNIIKDDAGKTETYDFRADSNDPPDQITCLYKGKTTFYKRVPPFSITWEPDKKPDNWAPPVEVKGEAESICYYPNCGSKATEMSGLCSKCNREQAESWAASQQQIENWKRQKEIKKQRAKEAEFQWKARLIAEAIRQANKQACSSGQTDKCDRPKGCVAHPRMTDTMHSIDKETGRPRLKR